jgi:hypothetical protein
MNIQSKSIDILLSRLTEIIISLHICILSLREEKYFIIDSFPNFFFNLINCISYIQIAILYRSWKTHYIYFCHL